jgi:protein tyrosine/serine phosphatase
MTSLALALALLMAGCTTTPRGFPAVGGIANLDQVNPHLYRGGQPNRLGLQYLHHLGVRTIVNLREPRDTWVAEADEARALGMNYINVPAGGFERPKTANVNKVLSIIEQAEAPVFVHCQHGCDRTGTIIACYRIRHDGWTSRKALQEARTYGMYWWEIYMQSFVKAFEKSSHTEAR